MHQPREQHVNGLRTNAEFKKHTDHVIHNDASKIFVRNVHSGISNPYKRRVVIPQTKIAIHQKMADKPTLDRGGSFYTAPNPYHERPAYMDYSKELDRRRDRKRRIKVGIQT